MILSVSRRTDIPAFYPDWLYNRVREGYVCVRNPMNARQVSRFPIDPSVVDCIVFWTKNAKPMLKRLDELEKFDYYFQFTLNNYGADTEPHVPDVEERLETFAELSGRIGRERVIWRYDPIVFTKKYTPDHHLKNAEMISKRLAPFTEKCVISFVDIYTSKNSSNLSALGMRQLSDNEMNDFLGEFSRIIRANDLAISTCAERIDASRFGIEHNSCIDGALIERITGCKLNAKPDGQREYCKCIKCGDIGSYDTCPHACVYCYANYRPKIVTEKSKRYDPDSPLLCDAIMPNDRITDRPVKSLKIKNSSENGEQITLF